MSRIARWPVRAMIGATALAAGIAACSSSPQAPAPTIQVQAPLAQISATHLPKSAEEAITACSVDLDRIAGIGLVSRARDVPSCAPLTGREPELQSDRPAWVIAIGGQYTAPLMPGTLLNPTCVVIDGVSTMFATGGAWDDQGVFESPGIVQQPGRLPPLGP